MKVKTSITLSEDVLAALDRMRGGFKNRSAFIEAAVRAYLRQLAKQSRDTRDLDILNRNSDRLNQEAEDVLEYQVEL
jgi:metal-responsive CopG/Arc/MetJ family transcriptional regulator